ncbi:MAG: flavin prenyltransferase [Clostridiales bacterium]|nr:flavin prenyltransferase [Clostridiales bacterium]
MKHIVVGITGASGSLLGSLLVESLLKEGHHVYLVVTPQGEQVLSYELETTYEAWISRFSGYGNLSLFSNDDLFAPMASGSFPADAMVVAPCSMGTLAKVASGIADNLLCRAADVSIKEKRPLILMVRETPLSSIHLENMLKLSRAGVTIFPPVPAYYNQPITMIESARQTVARVLQTIGITTEDMKIWGV